MVPMHLSLAQVYSRDADTLTLWCFLVQNGAEGPALPVRMLTQGPCDGLRINQPAMPARGTLGVVAALDGDCRSMVWLGSLPLNGQDAITVLPGQQNIAYQSHWSGFYSMLDEGGNFTARFPDGSALQVGTAQPLTRHIVGTNGLRQIVDFPDSERTNNVPSPFPFSYTSPTGAKFALDGAGNVSVSGASISIFGNTTVNGNLVVSGDVTSNDNNIVLSTHIHGGVQTGAGSTAAPTPNT